MSHKPRPKLVHIATVPMTLEFFLRGQMEHIKDHGFDVMGICSPGPGLGRMAKKRGVVMYPIEMSRSISPLSDIRALIRLWKTLRELRPEIVHASTGKAGPLGMIAATLAGVPVRVYTLRGIMTDRASWWSREVFRLMDKLTCALAHQVIAVSDSVVEVIADAGICPRSKMKVLGKGSSNGVDAIGRFNPELVTPEQTAQVRQRLSIPVHSLVVGFVGRLTEKKGIRELLTAWQSISRIDPSYRLLLVGPFEELDPLPREIVKAIEEDRSVIHEPFVPNEEMPAMYSVMDVAALPTYSEGFPNVALEAAAMGLPIAATRVTGCVDAVVGGETGLLVQARDSGALAAAIGAYLQDDDLRSRHGRAARERVVRDFRPEDVWRGLHEEYTRLLRQRGPNTNAQPKK